MVIGQSFLIINEFETNAESHLFQHYFQILWLTGVLEPLSFNLSTYLSSFSSFCSFNRWSLSWVSFSLSYSQLMSVWKKYTRHTWTKNPFHIQFTNSIWVCSKDSKSKKWIGAYVVLLHKMILKVCFFTKNITESEIGKLFSQKTQLLSNKRVLISLRNCQKLRQERTSFNATGILWPPLTQLLGRNV